MQELARERESYKTENYMLYPAYMPSYSQTDGPTRLLLAKLFLMPTSQRFYV